MSLTMPLLRLLLCVIAFTPATTIATVLKDEVPISNHGVEPRQAIPRPGELVDFQVYQPVFVPEGTDNQYGCIYRKTLMEHVFGNSYGAPYVGDYTPPPCDFNRVVMNLTVTSRGRQFDRLALMYLGDTEVFRTSTAEPTNTGIIWTYLKEMQHYNALWKQSQTLVFDLGNIQNDIYTGPFEVTLTATYFTIPDSPATADQILPISSRSSSSGMGSAFQVPDANASVQYTLPKDINRAVVSLSACGQSNEEFWYSNVPDSAVDTFADTTGTLPGGGTFREVQLLIDGRLSGVSWPFPVIFTGGIVPGFWRPIVGIDAFDLQQHEIDITPWLGYLLDGKSHTFEIRVASVDDDGKGHTSLAETPTSYWVVSGSIFLFKDPSGKATKGTLPKISTPNIQLSEKISTTQTKNGTNETLTYTTTADRTIYITSDITTGNGTTRSVSWAQKLSYSNYNKLTSFGSVQLTKQSTVGVDTAVAAGNSFTNGYSFPLTVNSSYIVSSDGNSFSLSAQLTRGKQLAVLGNPVFPSGLQNFRTSSATNSPVDFSDDTSTQTLPAGVADSARVQSFAGTALNTSQVGSAFYSSLGSSFGTTEQVFSFGGTGRDTAGGVDQEFYNRHVKAVNSTVVQDQQTLLGRRYGGPSQDASGNANTGPTPLFAQAADAGGVRQFLGRGPGKTKGLGSKGGG